MHKHEKENKKDEKDTKAKEAKKSSEQDLPILEIKIHDTIKTKSVGPGQL